MIRYSISSKAGMAILSCAVVLGAIVLMAQEENVSSADVGVPARILVGADYKNYPYEFMDDEGQPAGLGVDLIRSVAASVGLQVDIRLGSKEEIRKALSSGEIDMVIGMYTSKQREKQFDFARPHRFVKYSVFVKPGSAIKSPDDLRGKTVVVQRSSVMDEYMREEQIVGRLVSVEGIADALRLLAHGDYDCALLPKSMAMSVAAEAGIEDIEALEPPIARVAYGFAVKKGAADLVEKINEGMGFVRSSGRYAELKDKWFAEYEDSGGTSLTVGRVVIAGVIVLVILGVCGIVVGVVVTRSRESRAESDARIAEMRREVAELRRMEEVLQAEKGSLVALLKNAPHGVVVLAGEGADMALAYCNGAATDITGYSINDASTTSDLISRMFPDPDYRKRLWKRWQEVEKDGFRGMGFTVAVTAANGQVRRVDFQSSPIGSRKVIIMFSDVTQKYEAEEEQQLLDEDIRQSQKLEAMGQLAGGVAHDFNNILTSVLGNAQMLQMDLDKDSEQSEMVSQIVGASKRAGELTKQLLAYARKGKFQVVEVDIHETIRDSISLLSHSVDKLIEIEEDLAAEKPIIMGDSSQLQAAFLNLGVNARDAMPDGGTLTFSTGMVDADREFCRKHSNDIVPGRYLEVRVQDTGVGMEKSVARRIFEPFFTTKEQGKGTGLGLAAVYGCVKNHNGTISVDSDPGKGTQFAMLLPVVGAKKVAKPIHQVGDADVVKGKGHVLLVDDEESVRQLTARALRRLGYKVSTCVDGAEGVAFFRENYANVDIVIMDLIMPRMDGRTAFREMKKIDNAVRVLVVSGFAAETTAMECMHEGALDFVAKPFWIGDLSQAVATYIRPQEGASVGQRV